MGGIVTYQEIAGRFRRSVFWTHFQKNKLGLVGAGIVLILAATALLALSVKV